MTRRRRLKTLLKRHHVGTRLMCGVLLLQGAMLLTLFVTRPMVLPPRIRLAELLWASMREPIFYPLVALLAVGPALSILALTIKGWHRWGIVLSWAGFVAVIHLYYHQRMITMLRSLYWAMTY
jgi:hypothetical protein